MRSKPSTEQIETLRRMRQDPTGRLVRLPGGFWSTPSTPRARNDRGYDVPEWSTAVQTVRAMEARGWVARTNAHAEDWRDDREITDAGRLLA